MDREKTDRFEITELFMAKADKCRCFFGIIKRWTDNDGNPKVFSKICMPDDGYIVAQATDQKILGKMLDEMCIYVLDYNLHKIKRLSIEVFKMELYLN